MSNMDIKKLTKLIENLVDKLVEAKVERIVEERLQKLTPMLVEHEVNRILREHESEMETNQSHQPESTGNRIADSAMGDSVNNKSDLREHFKKLIGADISTDNEGNRTISMNSSNVVPPQTTAEGKPVDKNDPNIQGVLNAMNQDFSSKLKDMRQRSKQRGGRIN